MEFVMIGDVGGAETYHVGDEAMLEANIEFLRRYVPGASFSVLSRDPAFTSAAYGVKSILPLGFDEDADPSSHDALLASVLHLLDAAQPPADRRSAGPLRDLIAALSAGGARPLSQDARARFDSLLVTLARSTALFISGGGNLCSTWPHHLYERVALILMASWLGKPVGVLGQTLGPHLAPRQRDLLSAALQLASVVVLRENASYELAASMGVPRDRLIYSLDDAFFLEGPELERRDPGPASFDMPPDCIALTFSTFLDPNVYVSELDVLARQLGALHEATGAPLVFIPHAGEAKGTFPDQVMAQRLQARLNGALHICDLHSARTVRALTGAASLVISNRYHPLVFGLASGVPCLGIYTDDYTRVKLQGAMRHADLVKWTMPLDAALNGELGLRAQKLWRERETVRCQLLSMQEDWACRFARRWERVLERVAIRTR